MFGRNKNDQERQQKLGKAVEMMLVKDYIELLGNTKRLIWSSLVRGVFVGFGTVIGATVMVGLLLWILSLLNDVPWVGKIFENLQQTINDAKQ